MVTDNQNIINRQIIMLQKRYTVTKLAEKINKTRQGVNRVIVGDFKSIKLSADMLDAVSLELGVTKESFWPEFFSAADASGNNENNQHEITAPQFF